MLCWPGLCDVSRRQCGQLHQHRARPNTAHGRGPGKYFLAFGFKWTIPVYLFGFWFKVDLTCLLVWFFVCSGPDLSTCLAFGFKWIRPVYLFSFLFVVNQTCLLVWLFVCSGSDLSSCLAFGFKWIRHVPFWLCFKVDMAICCFCLLLKSEPQKSFFFELWMRQVLLFAGSCFCFLKVDQAGLIRVAICKGIVIILI